MWRNNHLCSKNEWIKYKQKRAKEGVKVNVEKEAITKDAEDEVGASTTKHKRHKLETAREK